MIHAAAPRTHRRRHGDAGCSRSSERRRRHLYRHALFTRPPRVEAVARGPTLRWPLLWSQDTSGSRNLWRLSEDGAVPREGAKGDALAASSKPARPIASVRPQEPVSSSPCLGHRASERIWLRADSTPGRRLEVGRVLGLAH